MSSIGLITERGTYDCVFHDNLLFNNSINLRIHSYNAVGYPRREYHYRNISYLAPDRVGTHFFIHSRVDEPWPGEPEDPELYIYHNTYLGGSNNARGHNLSVRNIYRKTIFVNNIFSTPGNSFAEGYLYENQGMMKGMDYNWLPSPVGRPNPKFKKPLWIGTNNVSNEGRLLWNKGVLDFIIPAGSRAKDSGIDISKPFSICGQEYPALPGMEPGYFSGKAPALGALQEGETISELMFRELTAK
jgi:hypothetical protein